MHEMQDSENKDSDIDDHISKVTRKIKMINGWKLKHSHLADFFEQDFEYTDSIEIPDREELKNSEELTEFVLISTKLQFIIGKITEHLRILNSAEEEVTHNGLINRVKHQLAIIGGCRNKYAQLIEIFEQDFQFIDAIVIPTSETLQSPEQLKSFLLVSVKLKLIFKKVTDYVHILNLDKQMIELMPIQSDEDLFITRNDTDDVDYNFLVCNLSKQVKSFTREMVQLKAAMHEKDSTITKLVSELLVLNQTLREKNDEIAKLKLQTTNKRWSPSYLSTKEESK